MAVPKFSAWKKAKRTAYARANCQRRREDAAMACCCATS